VVSYGIEIMKLNFYNKKQEKSSHINGFSATSKRFLSKINREH